MGRKHVFYKHVFCSPGALPNEPRAAPRPPGFTNALCSRLAGHWPDLVHLLWASLSIRFVDMISDRSDAPSKTAFLIRSAHGISPI
jgi:hypothetical protein